jgi:disulfide bond formation protein DsbB
MPGHSLAPDVSDIDRLATPRTLLGSATLVAVVATAGSLYLSEGLGLIPCELCWVQRILMYPLVVVLGVATYERRPAVYRTVLPLSVLGTGVAAYHSSLQVATTDPSQCTIGSCGAVQLRVAGLTIPNLSLLAFLLITGAVVACRVWLRPAVD